MNYPRRFYLFTVLFIAFFAACSSEPTQAEPTSTTQVAAVESTETETAVPTLTATPTETPTPQPTDTPAPTATPTHTPTPEGTPDPFPGYDSFSDDSLNLVLRFPETWVAEQPEAGGLIILAENDNALLNGYGQGTLIMVIPDTLTITPESYVYLLMEAITSNEDLVTQGVPDGYAESVTINDYPAARVTYTAVFPQTNEKVRLFFTAVQSGNQLLSFFTILPLSTLKETQAIYENIVSSVDLGEATAVSTLDKSLYFVADYDPERDPAEDVAGALEIAVEEGKQVLLEVGGEWCITCHMLDGFIEQTPEVAAGLQENFVIVKVNYSEDNENEPFLSQYPQIEWFPHFFILNADGTLAESYDTRGLETDGVYDEAKFLAFLNERAGESSTGADYYFVADYDPARDPQADVAAVVAVAQASNKHILLIAGGDWRIWCHVLAEYMHQTPAVETLLSDNYLIIKVNYSEENTNDDFFAQYPDIAAYPHLIVLDSNGEFLHSQSTGNLESGDSYDEAKMVEFFTTWAPPGS